MSDWKEDLDRLRQAMHDRHIYLENQRRLRRGQAVREGAVNPPTEEKLSKKSDEQERSEQERQQLEKSEQRKAKPEKPKPQSMSAEDLKRHVFQQNQYSADEVWLLVQSLKGESDVEQRHPAGTAIPDRPYPERDPGESR